MIPFGKDSDQDFSSWKLNGREVGATEWTGKERGGDEREVGHFLIEMRKCTFGLSSLVKRSAWDTCLVLE